METGLRVELLGRFAIIHNGEYITEQARKSSKIWKLLQYIVTNRHRSVSQEELLEVFCDEEMQSNPGSVLRTMVYRARGALEKSGLEFADNIILAKSGSYSWNNSIPCTTDIEEFENLIKKAHLEDNNEKRLQLLLTAAELYKGDFLPTSSGELWVIPLVRYYRTLYLGCVHDALEIMDAMEHSVQAEELCTKALCIDPFDEQLIEHHLNALLSQDKIDEANTVYKKMETMFFDVLGVDFSDKLRLLYNKIQFPEFHKQMTLNEVVEDWLTNAGYPGAYYCDAGVFKIIFQIEARSLPRSGRMTFIVRFDTKHDPKSKSGGIMKQLGEAIPKCLRMGDIYTRSSPSQYMVLLYSLTYEDCKMVIDRILRSIDSKNLHNLIGTHYKHVDHVEQANEDR